MKNSESKEMGSQKIKNADINHRLRSCISLFAWHRKSQCLEKVITFDEKLTPYKIRHEETCSLSLTSQHKHYQREKQASLSWD